MRLVDIQSGDHRRRYVVVNDDGTLVEPIVRYLKHLDRRGYARNTLRSYGGNLKLFFEYLAQTGVDHRHVTLDELAGFVQWLKLPSGSITVLPGHPVAQARSNSTINTALKVVSGFYDYLWRVDGSPGDLHAATHTYLPARARSYKGFLHHLVKDKPLHKHLLTQPTPKRRPKTLTKEQVARLIAACDNERDRLLLVLLYESALRIGEALALWLEDIDVASYRLHVRDRGELANGAEIKTPAAERAVDVSPDLVYRIMDYVAGAHTEGVATNHLFVKMRGPHAGQPLAYADVNDLFQRLARKTGITASAHLLRHSSLTALARIGWAPEHLRVRAGHAHFQTTYQLYVHPSEEDLRAEWERTQLRVQVAEERAHGAGPRAR